MTKRGTRVSLLFLFAVVLSYALSCGDVSNNQFNQTLSFEGFFAAGTTFCSEAELGGQVVQLDFPTDEDVDPNCTLAGFGCFVQMEILNRTTGDAGTDIDGPNNETVVGIDIFVENIHIEYLLPTGFLPPRDFPWDVRLPPSSGSTGEGTCFQFEILRLEDMVNMVQDPLSFPATPFRMVARVTVQGVTQGGLFIETSADLVLLVF